MVRSAAPRRTFGGRTLGARLTQILGGLGAVLAITLGLLVTATPASAVTAPAPAVEVPQAPQVSTPEVEPVAPIPTFAPVAPEGAEPGQPAVPTGPGSPLDLRQQGGAFSNPVALVLLLGTMSLIPALLIMVTAFTRIVIVLGLTRSALGTQGVPPTQVLIGLAIFLTLFVMGPVFSQANEQALHPYLKQEIDQGEAFERGLEPFRGFMLKQVREKDLELFVDLSGKPAPATPEDTPTTTLIPAFVISELRAAFLIGFIIFIPFVVIDLVVSAALSAMGMAMLPPSLISLPFKLLLFVAVDGWHLLTSSLVQSFA